MRYLFFILVLVVVQMNAQNATFNPDKKIAYDKEIPVPIADKLNSHKVLLIPMEPRMFLTEIGKPVSKETGMDFNQQAEAFREGMDAQLLLAFRKAYPTITLLADTSRTQEDIDLIYKSIGYDFVKVPAKENEADKKVVAPHSNDKPLDKNKKNSMIQNGQLVVPVNYDKKYMATKVNNPRLLKLLNEKFHTDIFVFANELDIKNDMNPNDADALLNGAKREATLHYTIMDKDGKVLDSNIATAKFAANLNDPKKIKNTCLAQIALTVFNNLEHTKKQEAIQKNK